MKENAIIVGENNLTMNQARFIDFILMKLATNPTNEIELSVKEFAQRHGFQLNNAYRTMVDAMHGIDIFVTYRKVIWDGEPWDKTEFYNWFDHIQHDRETLLIKVRLSSEVIPPMHQLSQALEPSDFEVLRQFTSVYARALYYWMKAELEGVEYSSTLTLTMDELNARLGVNYSRYTYLSHNVLLPASRSVNRIVDGYTLTFEPLFKGRKVIGVKFKFYRGNKAIDTHDNLKPVRPTLPKCHARKGTKAYKRWAKECIEILVKYQQEVEQMGWKLIKTDEQRLFKYYQIVNE